MPLNPIIQGMVGNPAQLGIQPVAPGTGAQAPAVNAQKPPVRTQDGRRDNPQVEERERAVIANRLGTVRDFGDNETAYFRVVEDFKNFAKQLGVDRAKLPDMNQYLAALDQAASYYLKTGRWDEVKSALMLGGNAPPY